jgi:hypothetical protein
VLAGQAMTHDGLCETTERWPGCQCGLRAFWRDPMPAADLPVVVENLTWDGT